MSSSEGTRSKCYREQIAEWKLNFERLNSFGQDDLLFQSRTYETSSLTSKEIDQSNKMLGTRDKNVAIS